MIAAGPPHREAPPFSLTKLTGVDDLAAAADGNREILGGAVRLRHSHLVFDGVAFTIDLDVQRFALRLLLGDADRLGKRRLRTADVGRLQPREELLDYFIFRTGNLSRIGVDTVVGQLVGAEDLELEVSPSSASNSASIALPPPFCSAISMAWVSESLA